MSFQSALTFAANDNESLLLLTAQTLIPLHETLAFVRSEREFDNL